MTFIAGAFSATYNAALGGAGAQSLGTVEDGFDLEEINYAERVIGDNLGESTQEHVNRGKDVFLSAVFIEADLSAVMRAIHPYVNVSAIGLQGAVNQPGLLGTNFAGILTLTAFAGTTAAAAMTSLTARKAVLAPNQSIRRLHASRLRKIPIRFQLLPYVVSNVTYYYEQA